MTFPFIREDLFFLLYKIAGKGVNFEIPIQSIKEIYMDILCCDFEMK